MGLIRPVTVASVDAPGAVAAAADFVCDGTDDQVQLQAAHDALPSTGGAVYLSLGNFYLSDTWTVDSESVAVIGANWGQRTGATQNAVGTRLNAVSGFAGGEVIRVARVGADRPVYGVLLRDFAIDGGDFGTGVDGIYLSSNRYMVEHVHVHQMSGDGVIVEGTTGWDTYDSVMAFCEIADCAGAGLRMGADSADGHLVHCILYNNADNWVNEGGGSQQITGCHFYNGTRYNLYFNGSGSRTKVSNCKIEGAGQHGVCIDSTNGGYADLQFVGNGFSTNGDSADNTYDHLNITGPSANGVTRTLIVGNSFGWKGAGVSPNKPRYGVNFSSASQFALVTGNTFGSATQFGTGPVGSLGSSSAEAKVKNNVNHTSTEDLTPPPGVPMFITWPGGSWPARSTVTSDSTRLVIWVGGSTQPSGMATDDLWIHD